MPTEFVDRSLLRSYGQSSFFFFYLEQSQSYILGLQKQTVSDLKRSHKRNNKQQITYTIS